MLLAIPIPAAGLTSIVIGAIVSAVVVYLDWRGRQNQVKYGFSVSPAGVGIDWQQAIKGLVLLAVWFDVRSRVKS